MELAKESKPARVMAALRSRVGSLLACFAGTEKAFPERAEHRQSRIRKRSSIAVE